MRKKQLYYTILINLLVLSHTVHASTNTKCIKQMDASTCYIVNGGYAGNGLYTSNFTANCSGTEIEILAECGTTPPSTTYFSNAGQNIRFSTTNPALDTHCYCKMTRPLFGMWTYFSNLTDRSCYYNCGNYCLTAFMNNQAFRTALFQNVMQQ